MRGRLAGQVTTAFKITKGTKRRFLARGPDAGTGNFTGKAEKVEEIALEVLLEIRKVTILQKFRFLLIRNQSLR